MDPTNLARRFLDGPGSQVRSTPGGGVLVGLPRQRSAITEGEPQPVVETAVPCLALPGRSPAAVHLDGACRCFCGGPAPTTR